MKRKLVTALFASITFLSLVSGILASVAWFNIENNLKVGVSGSVVEEYFHCGTGTRDDPFVITRPIHFYHLVEFFQRETELPSDDVFGTDYLYFQVGYDIDGDEDLEVYNYDNQGIYQGDSENPSYSTTLNMAYYSGDNALMPIGTNEVPFIGSFDGSASAGITIANINIHCSETVVVNKQNVTRTASDIGVFGYISDMDSNSSATVIKNSKFDGVTIDLTGVTSNVASSQTSTPHTSTHDDQAYVGYIAGHVHSYTNYSLAGPVNASPLYNVYVDNATIKGGAGVACSFGYIGLVDTIDGENAATVSDLVEELSTTSGGGSGGDWGGSIDMQSLYTNLSNIERNSATYVDEHEMTQTKLPNGTFTPTDPETRVLTENAFKNYSNGDNSYCFANKIVESNTNDIIFLTGSRDKRLVVTDQTEQRKTVYFNNFTTGSTTFYVPNFSNANLLIGSVSSQTLPADGEWFYDGVTPNGTGSFNLGHVWFERNGEKYYLSVTPNQISSYYRARVSATDNSYTWNWVAANGDTGTRFGETYRTGYLTTSHAGGTYSFYALNSMRSGTGTKTNLCSFFKESYTTTITENTGVKDVMNDTCFAHTTGYIVSGSDYRGNVYPRGSGNIRVAQYPSSSISDASTILTYNASGNVTATASLFGTYTETKEKFDEMVAKDTSSYYGLHFMNATIGDGYATIPSTGKKMPKNSVEFNVAKKGSIKFFAGTYFGVGQADVNNAFFSLYKVNRNGNDVSSLTEIKYIYEKAGEDYIYSDSATAPNGYTLAFNTAWITNPSSITTSRIYYFEIPVNAGEYALGSISGKNGSFLLYLDIGSNGGDLVDPTFNQANMILDTSLFTQIDFQINAFVTNSCFNVAYVIPSGATKDNFDITISYAQVTIESHSYTCYEVNITNGSGSLFEISTLLMDNDSDPDNEYYYMYAITYNGGTRVEYHSSNTFRATSSATTMTPVYS